MDINYRLLSPIWCLATMFVGCLGGPGVEPPAEPEDKVKNFGDNGEGDRTTAIALPDAGIGMGGMTGSVTTQTTGAGGSIAKGAAGTAGVTKTGAAGKSGAADVAVDAGGEPPAGTGGAGKTGASGKKAGAAGKTGAGGKRAGEGAGGTIGGAGVGGAAGTAGTGGGPATDQPKPPCLQDPRQVVLIGDSYITWVTHTFPNDLATASGDIYPSYRNYAVGRYAMASGGTGLIPPQFDRAVADNPDIIAAVVSGGANDVWIADTAQYPNGDSCKNDPNSPNIPDCQAIAQRALEAFTALVDRMANAGVKDIVYIFYPRVPAPTFLGGRSPNEIADYARPKYKAVCDGATARTSGKLNCHFLDLNTVLDDQNGEPITALFAATDIHPNRLGSNRMAEAVWSLMKKSCIAQQVSSGCCAP
jgi:lysophospholipase L1-like esterase